MRSIRREIEEEEREVETNEYEEYDDEEEEEEEIIDNLSHKHPLILVQTSTKDYCYGCRMYFSSEEQAYGCSKKCGYTRLLHEECAGLPRRITHAVHPQHILIQQHFQHLSRCSICERYIWSIGYGCESGECEFQMHIRCAQGSGVMDAAEEDVAMRHASHPEHELRLWERPFRCVACGTTQSGNSYICNAAGCQYWIHGRCAALPQAMEREDHHHSLSLSYHVPLQYIKFDCKCGVCNKYFLGIYWIYHCELCRYAVHLKCAIKEPTTRQRADMWEASEIGYKCADAECEIQMHIGCAQGSNVMDDDEQRPVMLHPGHLYHELKLWRGFLFKCVACGAPPRGRSYICTDCEYWIHERCTSFPQVIQIIDHRRHSLSLSFSTPLEYTKLDFTCKICYEDLVERYWIYHCELCRYVVHFKCALKKMTHATIRKNDEIEEEEEELEETLALCSHEHPLTLAETRKEVECYGCERLVTSGELAYACSKKCGYQGLLHEECGEMTIMIRHPLHPQHILSRRKVSNCSICKKQESSIGYRCTSFSACEFQIHMRCALDNDDDVLGRATLRQSHPQHELRLLKRSCSFRCDACGIKHRGKSYICTSCEYRIHHSCASLPETFKREDHDHALSLSFCAPLEYIEYDFKCEVCRKDLLGRFWIYHCRLCRYAVHIGCVFRKPTPRIFEDDEKCIIRFPVYDVAEEQIQPFVMMKGEAMAPIPDDAIDAYEFYKDKHQMRLVSSSHGRQNEEENSDDEDDYGQISRLMCDGCATPIFQKQSSSSASSSSSSKSKYYYMSCSEGKYFLHVACFLLPPSLSSIPLHNQPDHELVLQTCPKLELEKDCSFCKLPKNGLFYACKNKKCDFKADIKCATVPDTIRHAAHPQHLLKLVSSKNIQSPRSCAAACNASRLDADDYWYVCGSCKDEEEFSVHVSCATLPKSTKSLKWDKKHELQLTFDANLNHPGEFYCDECEVLMNPKRWMYHCRDCDLSFHPRCFKTTSGECRNIKFGCRVSAEAHQQHPLTYQLLTAKRRCDVCGGDRYERRGFHCAYCNFFICLSSDCGAKMIGDGCIQAVD